MIQSKAAVFGVLIASVSPAFARTQTHRIAPGQSIGQAHLGKTMESVEQKWGQPDVSDGATGHFWNSWFFPLSAELNVFSVRTERTVQAHVRQIRVTSGAFSTDDGISTRSSSAQIRCAFPQVRALGYYQKNGKRVDIYDDIKRGIAFEIARQSHECLGISVHRVDKRETQIFSPMGFKPLG